MLWTLLALASVGFWSLSSHIDKHFVEDIGSGATITRDYLVGFCINLVVFAVLVVYSGLPGIAPVMAGALVAAGIFEACYLRPYYRALEGDDASRVLTLFSFIPVFSLVLAYCLLGESVSAAGLAGGAIIVLGNIFVSWDPKRRGGVRLRTVALIAFASLLLAGNYVLYRFAVDGTRLGFTELLTWVSLGGALGSALNIVLSPEGRRELLDSGTYRGRRLYGLMFTNHALDQLGLLCAYAAYLFAPVFVVASIISALPLFALFLASFSTRFFSLLSGAKLSRYEVVQRIVAVSVTMAGLYLVQL